MKSKSLLIAATTLGRSRPERVGPGRRACSAAVEREAVSSGRENRLGPARVPLGGDRRQADPRIYGAMSMPYTFKDSTELAKLKAGDHITGDIVVAGSKTWVEKITVVRETRGRSKRLDGWTVGESIRGSGSL